MDKKENSKDEIKDEVSGNDSPSVFTGYALKFVQAAQDPDLGF